tara:strand:- start:7759 stop:8022 length:264 start_codon:yes stop_codon:yes gene_type:complete
MATPGLLLLMNSAAFAFYALHSKAVDRSILTIPLIFVGISLALSEPITRHSSPEFLYKSERLLAEVALILILFSDASYVRFARLRQN